MLELWGILVPILVTDVMNPVLLAGVVYALGTPRPFVAASSMVAGHTLLYFVAGIVLALALDPILEYLENPEPWHYGVSGVIGAALLVFGIQSIFAKEKPSERKISDADTIGPIAALGIGAVINLAGLPFAVPYVAALDQILRADLSASGAVTTLVGYNLLYALPFVIIILLRAIYRKDSERILKNLMVWVDRIAAVILPLLLLGLGAFLTVDAGLYFWRGEGLI